MRTAPPVSVHCTGGLMWRCFQTLLTALAAGVLATWLLAHGQWPPLITVWLVVDVVFLMAWWTWQSARQARTHLSFDGQGWAADGRPGSLSVMVDLGPWLLLRHRLEASDPSRWKDRWTGRWIAVSEADTGPAMHAMRAALYAPQPRHQADRPTQAGGAGLGDVGSHV
jgi:hypothetical protein